MQLPHVLLEVKVSAKALATDLTGERLLVIVRMHVEGQIVDLMKRFVADVALVRFLTAVRELVILVVTLLVKALTAELADKRFKIGMYARVGIEGGATIESLAARHALVRLFSGVDDLVPAKSARLTEAFAANLADKWPGARVHRHVSRQIVMRVEHFAAFRASKGLLLVRGTELTSRRRALLTALVLWRHGSQIQSRGSFLDRRGRWRTLRDRWGRGGRAWESPQ